VERLRHPPDHAVALDQDGELRDRFAAVSGFKDTPDSPDTLDAAALLGGAKEPPLTVSKALEHYWTLAKDKTLGKSEDQLRRWKNPRKKAVGNFIAVVGDKAIKDITGDDMLDFRNWCSLSTAHHVRLTFNRDMIGCCHPDTSEQTARAVAASVRDTVKLTIQMELAEAMRYGGVGNPRGGR